MTEEITLKVYRTSDLTEAAALWTVGHTMHGIEVKGDRATFVIGYCAPDEEFAACTDLYHQGRLLVEAREFARRRNEVAARMRRALAEAQSCDEGTGPVTGAVTADE